MASATPTAKLGSPTRPHASSSAAATSPPSRRDLKSWWKGFMGNSKHPQPQDPQEQRLQPTNGIFGVPLLQSIKYANVAISLVENDQTFICGYVPIVVAKCGVFLKEKATGVEGIFRLSGSEKRIKELKQIFDSPDRYGKGLVWDGYTVHDAANVLRRFLNDLPEPVVPLDLYEKFRAPLRGATKQAVGDSEGPQFVENFDEKGAIQTYQNLIGELPPLNRQLLLYILDLLAVFAAKSDENRMNSQNLAAIFQPGTLSHPSHAMAPAEYRLNQCVIIFLIENQDHFLIGMHGTGIDEQTKKVVASGASQEAPATPTKRTSVLGRSASNASAGADSVRRDGKIRRNRSVSSKNSGPKNVEGNTTPGSPPAVPTPTGGGLARSNTVPSKKSPALAGNKFRKSDASGNSPSIEPLTQIRPTEQPEALDTPRSNQTPDLPVVMETPSTDQKPERAETETGEGVSTPTRERHLTHFFQKSPADGSGEKRQPNKLRKKRAPGTLSPSAHSSNASLSQAPPHLGSPMSELYNPIEASTITKETVPTGSDGKASRQPSGTMQEDPASDVATAQAQRNDSALASEQEDKGKAAVRDTEPPLPNGGLELGSETRKSAQQESQSDSPEKKKHKTLLGRHKDEAVPREMPHRNKEALGSSTSVNSGSGKPRKSFTGESSEFGTGSFDSESKDSREEARSPMKWIKNKYREARNKSPTGEGEKASSLGGAMDGHDHEKHVQEKEETPEGHSTTQTGSAPPTESETQSQTAPETQPTQNLSQTTPEPTTVQSSDPAEVPKVIQEDTQEESTPAKETSSESTKPQSSADAPAES